MAIPDNWRRLALDPPRAHGNVTASGRLRASPEDFIVDEQLGFEPGDGSDGPHALLQVRKRGANTEWVARELARTAGCKPMDVGFAGLKDRHAVTTQWYTVPRGREPAEAWIGRVGEGYEVIAAHAHQRKLPRGALAGNRFRLRLRELDGDRDALLERCRLAGSTGVPNYFGPQRFGRELANLAALLRAAAPPEGTRPRRSGRGGGRGGSRGGESFVLSAARSLIFNAVLAERIDQGTWNRLVPGDIANLDARGSVFVVDSPDDTLEARCAALEVHPTGPLWGDSAGGANGAVDELERRVAEGFPEALVPIAAERMSPMRRALRVVPRELEASVEGDMLELGFYLPAGAFATTVLREVLEASEGGQGGHDA